jgi:hypothetical protein
MPFFKDYPKVPYFFGTEDFTVQFPDLVRYSEILDTVKINGAFYEKYYIRGGWRPDNVSQELYQTPDLHWIFFYLNDNLRAQGWPLDIYQMQQKITDDFPNSVIVTRDEIFSTFLVGSTITGITSGATGTIIKKNIDLGQLFIEGTPQFDDDETITVTEDGIEHIITISDYVAEKDAPLYYTIAGEKSDINPFSGPNPDQIPVSYADYYNTENENLRNIIVMKPEIANQFKREFHDAMRS